MKKALNWTGFLAVLALMAGLVGCEWESDSSGFNSSQGVEINFTGVYKGQLDGGQIVEGRSITRFVLTQAGNAVQIWDSNNSYYEGSVGSPGVVSDPVNDVYSSGAELVQAQVNFSGTDVSTGREIQFIGVVHAVAVKDITGDKQVSSSSSSSETNSNTSVSTSVGDTTTESNSDQAAFDVSATVYQLTEANTQLILEGNWAETGGATLFVQGRSSGTSGLITQPETDDDDDLFELPVEEEGTIETGGETLEEELE